MIYLLLLIGFILLIKGADIFVEGSSSIARYLGVPSVVIGLTIVAMGTSAPETAVSITAGLAGNSDISLGNIVGSNIFNLLVVIGVSALIRPVVSQIDIIRRDMWVNIGCTLLLLVLMCNGTLSRLNGLVLLAGMAAYLFFVVRSAMKERDCVNVDDSTTPSNEAIRSKHALGKNLILMLIGLIAIIIGGRLIVDNASLLAAQFGMSDTFIGLTIVAIGTSLPELATSVIAAKKGDSGIALGNAVGSCIFNIMFILGVSSLLTPIHVAPELIIDTVILVGVGILLFLFAKTKKQTSRIEGLICIACYVAYTIYILQR